MQSHRLINRKLNSTALGNAVGNTIGGGIGGRLAPGAASVERDREQPPPPRGGGGPGGGVGERAARGCGARCHAELRDGHAAAVTTVAWGTGVGGWHQVASVDKAGQLCIWD